MYAESTRPSAKRDDRIARPRRAQTCARSGQIFFYLLFPQKVGMSAYLTK